jgi:O-antigen/teichoic acid export membrane protein
MKRTFPLFLVFIFGILGIIPFIIPHPIVQNLDESIRNDILKILVAFALVLGLGSLLKVWIKSNAKERTGSTHGF